MAQRREILVQIPPDDYRRLKRMAVRQERPIEQQAAFLLRSLLNGVADRSELTLPADSILREKEAAGASAAA